MKSNMINIAVYCSLGIALLFTGYVSGGQDNLYVGWGQVDITPTRPVALVGQMHKRISKGVLDSLTATVLAIETVGENGTGQACKQSVVSPHDRRR